ncbi:unnamed protein product [Rangifer tarandus platyrhynchus]|uniref:Geranylgeranyl transferase type II subunit beta n=1 Tax=Rangifer tarandus platyrhynchus TaxID=3082113 RepID=A0ABN8YZN2_RANTA|nr:unnamed protein product [Rangifer tarandus platyrhynchus]
MGQRHLPGLAKASSATPPPPRAVPGESRPRGGRRLPSLLARQSGRASRLRALLGLCPEESPYSGVAAYRPLDCNGPGRRLTPSAVFHLFLLGLVILERAGKRVPDYHRRNDNGSALETSVGRPRQRAVTLVPRGAVHTAVRRHQGPVLRALRLRTRVGIWQLYRQKVVKEVLFSLSVMGTPQKDVIIKSDAPDILLLEKHADYIASYGSKKDDYEYCMSEYLRMSGIYWGLTVMDLMGQLHRMNREEILTFIKSCQHECGGISASIGHDPHLLYTLSAVQILTLYDSINVIDINKVVEYVQSLQKEDGSFAGDIWGPTKQLV